MRIVVLRWMGESHSCCRLYIFALSGYGSRLTPARDSTIIYCTNHTTSFASTVAVFVVET